MSSGLIMYRAEHWITTSFTGCNDIHRIKRCHHLHFLSCYFLSSLIPFHSPWHSSQNCLVNLSLFIEIVPGVFRNRKEDFLSTLFCLSSLSTLLLPYRPHIVLDSATPFSMMSSSCYFRPPSLLLLLLLFAFLEFWVLRTVLYTMKNNIDNTLCIYVYDE